MPSARKRQARKRKTKAPNRARPAVGRKYLRKLDVMARYGWTCTLSVDRAWREFKTIPEPTTWQSRSPLWAEDILDARDAANARGPA